MRRRRLSALLRIAPLVVVAVLVTGWLGATSWYPRHVERATGRTDTGWISCLRCHAGRQAPTSVPLADVANYVTPTGLAVSPDGATLFVVGSGTGELLRLDATTGDRLGATRVGERPHAVAVSGDGRRLAVTLRDDDEVLLLDAADLRQIDVRGTGAEPIGVIFAADDRGLWIANGASDDVSFVDLTGETAGGRMVAGNEPYAVARAANAPVIAVANRLAGITLPGEMPVSELTFIDAERGQVSDRRELVSAHLSEGVALSSTGEFALATAIRARNLLPLTQVSRGAVMNSEIVYADLTTDLTVQLPLDELGAYYADPASLVLTPDDRMAFVAHAGADTVTAIDVEALRRFVDCAAPAEREGLADRLDLAEQYVLARIPTRHNPQALTISPDGARLYVAERLADSIAVIDTANLAVIDRFELGNATIDSARRRGEIAFTSAAGTFQGQFSCRSCHPDGHTDGLIWDFVIDGVGSNLLETRSLRGVRNTAPFKWSGKNPDLATQCGPRFAMVLTRSDPFAGQQLADLVTFIESIPRAPARVPEELLAARDRGREIFFRTHDNAGEPIAMARRCSTCHRPPLYTDRLMTEVGSGGAFDTPHLFDVGSSAPYLHDGRAASLEEIWTVFSLQDEHGITGDLSKLQLNDLMVFLRSL